MLTTGWTSSWRRKVAPTDTLEDGASQHQHLHRRSLLTRTLPRASSGGTKASSRALGVPLWAALSVGWAAAAVLACVVVATLYRSGIDPRWRGTSRPQASPAVTDPCHSQWVRACVV